MQALKQQLEEAKRDENRLSVPLTSPTRKESPSHKLQALKEELAAKNELIEEANNIIIDYQDEKHELRAKFKYLVALAQNPDKTVSTYKSNDEIDIDYCFEAIEEALQNISVDHGQRTSQNLLFPAHVG